MKNLSAGVRVGILFMMLAIGAYLVWKNLGDDTDGGQQEFFVRMRDASGLPKGSKVVVAGLKQGLVTKLEVDGRYAKIHFNLSEKIEVWSSAVVYKKASSLLGENYLEIDPGEPTRQAPDGTAIKFYIMGPKCPDYDGPAGPKRDACREIQNRVEAITPDQLIQRIEASTQNVDKVLDSVRDLSEDVRRIVNGPMTRVANRIDGLVQKEADTVQSIIERADRTLAAVEKLTNDVRNITSNADPKINKMLDDLTAASAEAKVLVETAKKELETTGDAVRGKLDKLDGVIDSSQSIAKKIDEDKGTLGRLVNDPTVYDNVESITEDAKGFLGTLFGLKAYVGLRSELNIGSRLARHYISVELHTRPDKYYLIEIEKGPRGGYPEVTLTNTPADGDVWQKQTIIHDEIRFTFQFAKRFDWLTLRYGLKESTGGIGADADVRWWDHNLRISADLFDATFDQLPRVKLTAAVEMFRHLYILGGVDELLNTPDSLIINAGTDDVPIQFEEFRFGRDFFIGGMLRFNDEDLAALLTVGGSALAGASK